MSKQEKEAKVKVHSRNRPYCVIFLKDMTVTEVSDPSSPTKKKSPAAEATGLDAIHGLRDSPHELFL